MQLDILYESKWVLAVHKPAGLLVEKSPLYPSVEAWTENYLLSQTPQPFVGIVHRLDRTVSGVVLLAKRKTALKDLNEQFANRQIAKQYLALVENQPPSSEALLTHWLQKDLKNKKALIFNKPNKDAVKCELKYTYNGSTELGYLLAIDLITGKFHQIRAQLAAIGCPILGDAKYGATRPYLPEAIALHAWKLSFIDSFNGETQIVEAPVTPTFGW